eukprot:TRINITY_DN3448_c0_g1_i1.p1 TRINITY_DN3448_c0_g1~~TRINITY_DN3448_c0_g1_i1.p1  ORF type:complete len:363 (-),score=49.13 TRINITY_DN3448_c0_g1_i1:60-1148(-)
MRILVTGGAGFIGANLCQALLEYKNEVLCLDNLYSGRMKNIQHLLDNEDFVFLKHDVNEKLFLENIDQIYHLACPASPISYQYNPIFTMKTNVIGTLNILELAKKNSARFLITSTSEVYGDPKAHPQVESYWGNVNPIGIRSCYDEGKRAAESLTFDFIRKYGLDCRVCRLFNTYGPKMAEDDGRVVSNFINQAIRNQNITIYGSGEQTRSFCFVDDIIDGLIKLMNQDTIINISPINLGRPVEIKIFTLAQYILELITDSKSKIIYKPLPIDDPVKRLPDITKAIKILNWEPKITLEEGLRRTIEYFMENKKNENSSSLSSNSIRKLKVVEEREKIEKEYNRVNNNNNDNNNKNNKLNSRL